MNVLVVLLVWKICYGIKIVGVWHLYYKKIKLF